jgi:hypothetical protein
MQPATIICDSRLSQAARCGETALVRAVSYVYERERYSPAPVLREAQFQIDCPRCGQRTQVERFD